MDALSVSLAEGVRLPRMRQHDLLPAFAGTLPVPSLSSNLADRRYHLPWHAPSADHLVPSDVPADPAQEWHLGVAVVPGAYSAPYCSRKAGSDRPGWNRIDQSSNLNLSRSAETTLGLSLAAVATFKSISGFPLYQLSSWQFCLNLPQRGRHGSIRAPLWQDSWHYLIFNQLGGSGVDSASLFE